MSRQLRFLEVQDKRGKKVTDYGRFQISNQRGDMGKRIYRVGSRGHRNLMDRGFVQPALTGHYRTENGQFRRRTLEQMGRQISQNVVRNMNPTAMVQFDISIFVKKRTFETNRKFRFNPYTNPIITRGGEPAYRFMNRTFSVRCTARTVQDFLRRFSNPWYGSNEEAFNYFFDVFVPAVGGEGVIELDRRMLESIREGVLVLFENFRESTERLLRIVPETAYANDHQGMFWNCGDFLHRSSDTAEKPFVPFYEDDTESCQLPKGCWYYELIRIYKKSFDKYFSRNTRKQVLCVEWLWKLFHKDEPLPTDFHDEKAWRLNWTQACLFFEYIRVKAVMYNFKADVMQVFEPTHRVNDHISPEIFRCIYMNHHVDAITHNAYGEEICRVRQYKNDVGKKLKIDLERDYTSEKVRYEYTHFNRQKKEERDAVSKYDKKKFSVPLEPEVLVCNDLEELYAFIHRPQTTFEKWRIITNLDLRDIFMYFYERDILFNVFMKGGAMDNLTLRHYFKRNFKIENLWNRSCGQIVVEDVAEVKLFDKMLKEGKRRLLQISCESQHNVQVMEFFQGFTMGGLNGHFAPLPFDDCPLEGEEVEIQSFDYNRMYSSVLMELTHFPVFDADCYFVDYDGSPLDDWTQYWVRRNGDDFVYPFHRECLCYGIHLKGVQNISLLKMRRPIRVVENAMRPFFEELYGSSLRDDMKKNIGNILCGFLIQKFRHRHSSYFTKSEEEVKYMIDQLRGGSFLTLYKEEKVFGYIVHRHIEQSLLNGFTNMGLLLLDASYKKMDRLVQDLESVGLGCYAVQTDAIYFTGDANLFQSAFPHYFQYTDKTQFDAIGKLKYESKPQIGFSPFEPKEHPSVCLSPVTTTSYVLENEYETKEYMELIQKHRTLVVEGHAGYGKTKTTLQALTQLEWKTMVLCKTRALYLDLRKYLGDNPYIECQTADRFFGLHPKCMLPRYPPRLNEQNKHKDDPIKVILFDDFYLFDQRLFREMFLMMHLPQYQHLRFIGTCDYLQLDYLLRDCNYLIESPRSRLEGLGQRLFQNTIRLQYNKRLKDEQQRERNQWLIEAVKKVDHSAIDSFVESECNVISSLRMLPADVRHAIVAENIEIDSVNQLLFSLEHSGEEPMSVGHVIMSMEYYEVEKDDTKSFGKYEPFRIIEKSKKVKLQNLFTGEIDEYPHDILDKFSLPYTRTSHSWQGQTLQGKTVVVGWYNEWVDERWKYNTLGRVDDLKNLYLLKGHREVRKRQQREVKQSCIQAYYQQDVVVFRVVDPKYFIDVPWIVDALRACSYQCPCCESYIGYEWSVDRIDSTLPHYKSNCRIVCVKCNITKKDLI